MMLLDTNVLSERTKKNPDAKVLSWLNRLPVQDSRVSAMVIAEIAQGVENNPTPDLKRFLAEVLTIPCAPFGEPEALAWGTLTAAALSAGLTIDVRDSIIAATAAANHWTVATRNDKHFKPLGVLTFNPWD